MFSPIVNLDGIQWYRQFRSMPADRRDGAQADKH